MIDFNNPAYVDNAGVKLAVYRGGPAPNNTDKPAVIFLHGWPDIAYSWRSQMEAIAAAGYPVFAADGRGYGWSDAPEGVENYTMEKLTSDIAAVQDHFGMEDAVLVGHDWGAIVLWQTPFYIGDRVKGCAGMNVPHMPHYPIDPVTLFEKHLGKNMYIVRFQEEGACEPILERDLSETFEFFHRGPHGKRLERSAITPEFARAIKSLDLITMFEAGEDLWSGSALLSPEDKQIYMKAYARNGFTGPLHWYRNMRANWEVQQSFLVNGVLPKIEKPCLMFTADLDLPCPPRLADGMEALCEPYERIDYKGCSHWTQHERADDVNAALIDWLERYFN